MATINRVEKKLPELPMLPGQLKEIGELFFDGELRFYDELWTLEDTVAGYEAKFKYSFDASLIPPNPREAKKVLQTVLSLFQAEANLFSRDYPDNQYWLECAANTKAHNEGLNALTELMTRPTIAALAIRRFLEKTVFTAPTLKEGAEDRDKAYRIFIENTETMDLDALEGEEAKFYLEVRDVLKKILLKDASTKYPKRKEEVHVPREIDPFGEEVFQKYGKYFPLLVTRHQLWKLEHFHDATLISLLPPDVKAHIMGETVTSNALQKSMWTAYKRWSFDRDVYSLVERVHHLWEKTLDARKAQFDALYEQLRGITRTAADVKEYRKMVTDKTVALDAKWVRSIISPPPKEMFDKDVEPSFMTLTRTGSKAPEKQSKKKKKARQRTQRSKKAPPPESSSTSPSPKAKKIRKVRVWNLDFGEEVLTLPGKALSGFFHHRVERWREVGTHAQVASDHAKFPEYKDSENTRYQHAIHAFAREIDRFAEHGYKMSMEGNTYYFLPTQMELDGEKHQGVIVWARNEKGVIYHRCFEKKSLQDVAEKLAKRKLVKEDFSHVEEGAKFEMPKGKENKMHTTPNGGSIKIEPVMGVVTVYDKKLDATFRLMPNITVLEEEKV